MDDSWIRDSKYDRYLWRMCCDIKDKYPNGVPLNRADKKIVLKALRRHPRGKEKFGVGINAVVLDNYVAGSRCFFVIRADNTVEDFSLRKCLNRPYNQSPAKRVLMAMARFNYRAVFEKYIFNRNQNV